VGVRPHPPTSPYGATVLIGHLARPPNPYPYRRRKPTVYTQSSLRVRVKIRREC